MKRLVWLVLAVFCTAFAQVQPVEPLLPKADHMDCCGGCDGACGMPDCAVLPATPPQAVLAERPSATLRQEARRASTDRAAPARGFYLSVIKPAVVFMPLQAPVAAPAASPPLFRVHCSYLI